MSGLFYCYSLILVLFGLVQPEPLVGQVLKTETKTHKMVKNRVFEKAAVVTAHPLASEVGASILKAGGNAFDAAIAVQLALAVVYPGAGNIGGGGFLLGRKKEGQFVCLDYRETAPGLAGRDMYLDKAGKPLTDLSKNGSLSAGVPGTVAGLFATLPYCKLPFQKLIEPAISLAENGFALTAAEAENLNNNQNGFKANNSVKPVFLKENLWKPGDLMVQNDLAKTLKLIRNNGANGFYSGKTADLIVAEMRRTKGIITLADLKNYKVKVHKPLIFNYKGFEIIGMPPPGSGGILLNQMMKMVENRNLEKLGFQTPESVQLMIEAERRAFADRAEHMGDPTFFKVPVKTLTNSAYIENRMTDFVPGKASVSTQIKAGIISESEETTHLSIMDSDGNMVAVTTTLNGSYGSHTVVGGAGFLLNNEMDDFSIKPGVPNMYGAIGGEANAIAPNKTMLSSMTPTLVLKDGKPFAVVGTPGGTTIPTSVFQTLVNLIDFGMNATDAVNKPKFHHQWLPDEVAVEEIFPVSVRNGLEKMGYKIIERQAIGRVELIKVLPNGKLDCAADGRGDDSVAGE